MTKYSKFRNDLECKRLWQAWSFDEKIIDGERITYVRGTSANTCTTFKSERALFVTAIDHAATLIRGLPDIKPSQIEAAEPETRKLGDRWMGKLIDKVSSADREESRRFSPFQFFVEFYSEKIGYPPATIKSYLYTPSRQKKKTGRGRPRKKK